MNKPALQAVILAGGRGTRLKQITGDLPKPLMDIDGKPLLMHQLELMRRSGIADVLLLTGYRSQAIRDVVGDGAALGLTVRYQEESEEHPLGTAGALLDACPQFGDRIAVVYGDCMLNVDLKRMIAWHDAHAADATLFVHPNSHPEDSDLVEVDEDGRISAFHPYPHDGSRYYANLVNAAVYVIETRTLATYRNWLAGAPLRPDVAKHLFPAMLADGLRLFAYRSPEYVKDAGTPNRYAAVVRDVRSGRVTRSSLDHPQKAVFLDRDGTLNVEVNRVSTPSALQLIDGVGQAVRRLNGSEFRSIVVTNQPVLARGDCDKVALNQIHAKLDTLLGREGAYLDALYYCPHHPDRGFAGEVPELKIECGCRKPQPGMLLAAQTDFNIDFSRSWMIGDSTVDILTAARLGIRSILLTTGQAGRDGRHAVKPTHVFDSLGEAIDFILAAV